MTLRSGRHSPSLIRTAHGTAAEGGAVLVVECPPLDELRPLNAEDTEAGLALRKARGRPFEPGNAAAKWRKPSLATMGKVDVPDKEERRARRRAASLRRHRMRGLAILHGGDLSSGVAVELTSWALATAYSRLAYDNGEPTKGAALAEKASGHQLKAVGLAEREAEARGERTDSNVENARAVRDAEAATARRRDAERRALDRSGEESRASEPSATSASPEEEGPS